MTIKEIAALAGVSISTVSKIVNNKDQGINENTRNHVLRIVKEYNYTPYSGIKTASAAKSFIIGVLLKESSKPNLFLNGLLSLAQEKAYSIMIFTSSMDADTELKNITALIKNKVDGVIWEPLSSDSLRHARRFTESGIHIAYINAPYIPEACAPDFFHMGYLASKKLIERGHSDIACLLRQGSVRSERVLAGIKKCLFDHNLIFRDDMQFTIDNTSWKNKILSHDISAIISAHEQLNIEAAEFIQKINYQIPRDISMITLWDDAGKRPALPSYAGIKVPYYEFGIFICDKIIRKCEQKPEQQKSFSYTYALENENNIAEPFSKRKKKILVVGSINLDTTLSVEELPLPGNTVMSTRVIVSPGGKGANEAVGVARLGYPVSIIGKVGEDYDSSIVYKCMQDNRVDISAIKRDGSCDTGKAYIHLRSDGESLITVLAGANDALQPEDIVECEKMFEDSAYCLMQTEIPYASLRKAAKLAHRYGAKNVLKPAAMTRLDKDLMRYIDIFVPNYAEALSLCQRKTKVPEMAAFFSSLGPAISIITLAEKGVYVHSPDFKGYVPAVPFIPIDTTGGADAFISAFVVYTLEGYGIEKAARIGNYASAFCISRQGTIPALIDRASLESYIRRMEADLL